MAGWNSWNRVIYALWSPVYDRFVRFPPLAKARRDAMKLLEMKRGERVVLVGIGTGADLEFLPVGVQAVGVDLSEAMLAVARRKLPVPGCEVELRRADAEELPFADNTFDVAVLTLILSVVSDGAACLRETIRVLRPGGRVLVFDKFLPAGHAPSLGRRVLNLLTRPFGTDINRPFEPMMDGLPCRIRREEDSLFSGAYRAILLEKNSADGSVPAEKGVPPAE